MLLTCCSKINRCSKSKKVFISFWARKNIRKFLSRKILFSDEKQFGINGVYNHQNDRIWVQNREQADANSGIHRKTKFPQGAMIWLGVCYNGVTQPVIIENGMINHEHYINEILPLALKDG